MPPTTQICIRRDTAANFTSANPTLALGEIAYETDTRNIKVGDGATAWTALGYINPFRGGTAAASIYNTALGIGAGASMQSGAIFNTCIGGNAGGAITTAAFNVLVGAQAGTNVSTGSQNVAIGYAAYQVGANNNNTAVGSLSMLSATSGGSNTAVGAGSLQSNLVGNNNVAVGANALSLNTVSDITAVGTNALDANTTGTAAVAVGKDALGAQTTAAGSTAVGFEALSTISTSGESTAVGYRAMRLSTVGAQVAVGAEALSSLTSGARNVGVGHAVLNGASTTSDDTAVGYWAFINKTSGGQNVAVGSEAGRFVTAGTNCTAATSSIFIGRDARPAASSETNQIVIGDQGRGNGSNTTTIGNSSTTATYLFGSVNASSGSHNFGSSTPAGQRFFNYDCPSVSSSGFRATDGTANAVLTPSSGATGNAYVGTANNRDFEVARNNQSLIRLVSSGDVQVLSGNLVMSTSGKGIDFSATSDGTGTMTSELLSDYEEGTWTPTVAFGGASVGVTYAAGARVGRYTKIGRAVSVTCYIALSNKGSSTGSATITGLPFTVGQWCSVSMDPNSITFTGQISGLALEADTAVALKECSEAGTRTDITDADFTNSSAITVNFTYTV